MRVTSNSEPITFRVSQRALAVLEHASAAFFVGVVITFLALPAVAIIERSIAKSSLLDAIGSADVRDSLRLSFLTTTTSLILIVIFGTPTAYVLARRRFPGRRLLDAIVDLPIVLPPAVGGLGLLMAFGRRGLLGQYLDDLGISLAFTVWAVIMAQSFVAAPFYIRTAKAGFESIDQELEAVARTLGSSPIGTFWRVSVPLARPALIAGAVMAWARALGEFGATIMFAGSLAGKTQTMPLTIYRSLETGLDVPLALATMLIGISLVVLLIFRSLFQATSV